MPAVLIRDENASGAALHAPITLEFPTESITIRELIRERVYQEVQDYNRRKDGAFRGLVQPTDAEAALNCYRLRVGHQVDWKEQFARACEAFERSGVVLLVGQRQATSLDEIVSLTRGVEVTFLRLTPLVGG